MKIAYILEGNFYQDSGILRKVKGQIKEWEKGGAKVYPIIIASKRSEKMLLDGQHFYSKIAAFIPITPVKSHLNKVWSLRKVNNYLAAITPDIVYIRQTTWCYGLDNLLSKQNSLMELNTNDVSEIAHAGLLKRKLYLWGREKLIHSVKGFVSVSYEIEKLYVKYKKPIVTIANGIDFSTIARTQKIKNEKPQVVFVGSPRQAWQGIEEFVTMARLIPQADFHLVGPELDTTEIPANLKPYGYLGKDELTKLYQKMDIGVGTLSLHKKKMDEASPLKVREYLAYALPCIIGYQDTDLNSGELPEFILNIENKPDNVREHIEEIEAFIEKYKSYSVDLEIIKKIISTQYKEQARTDFFQQMTT